MKELSLSQVINGRIYTKEKGWHDVDITLTEEQKAAFIELFGKRCSDSTKRALKRFINFPKEFSAYGIYDRVMFTEKSCKYVAGQSYPDEIRTVRQLIIKG